MLYVCVCVCVCVCVKWGTWWTEGFQEYGIEKVGLWGRKLEETGEDCMMGSSMIFILTKYYCNNQIKEDEISGACCMYGRKEKCFQGFDGDTWRRETLQRHRHRWEDIKMDLQEAGCEVMDWICLAQDRNKLQSLVSTVMNLWVS